MAERKSPAGLRRALRRLARATQRLERATVRDLGLTPSQAVVLVAVGNMGQPAMRMLAQELGIAPSTVTRQVDPLVKAGLAKRGKHPDDRRVVVVELTRQGRKRLERLETRLDRLYQFAVDWAKAPRGTAEALNGLTEAMERVRLTSSA